MIKEKDFILKGDICYSLDARRLKTVPEGYLVCVGGKSAGVYESFDAIPEPYRALPLEDYSGRLIVPGLYDLHVHAPQYAYRGLGMDMELLEWLDTYAFPEEAKYKDLSYGDRAYEQFVHDLKYSPTARFAAFATIHSEGTLMLMEKLEASGLYGYVGKVSMDRNSPDYYCETDTGTALADAKTWALEAGERFDHVKPLITPRFTPSCSDELMEGLGALSDTLNLRTQSHLSENLSEMEWVKELCPWAGDYLETYRRPGLIGAGRPSLMAHCVYVTHGELKMMKENNVFAVHCPQCNMNIASGLAKVRTWMDAGIPMGLGTDVAGGATLSIFRAMMEARQVSKLVWRLLDQNLKPLTLEEIFWMGTMGGGAFFGKAGSFEKDYELDALILDESRMAHPRALSLKQRLERYICLSGPGDILHKYVAGKIIF